VPIDRTAVSTAAAAAGHALELLAHLIRVSKPQRRDEWLASVERDRDQLRRAAEDDIAAYNRYLAARRAPAGSAALQLAMKDAIDVPLQAARIVIAALELSASAAPSLRPALAADLAVVQQILGASAHGILVNLDVNLAEASAEPFHASARAERHSLAARLTCGAPAKPHA